MEKSPDAFRTISEVADLLETPAHVLRFWETRFPQVRPVKRAGGRRYYRPGDVALLAGIRRLLHDEGMTIRGVQKVLREQGIRHVAGLSAADLSVPELSEAEDSIEAQLAAALGPVADMPDDAPETAQIETAQIIALEAVLAQKDAARAAEEKPPVRRDLFDLDAAPEQDNAPPAPPAALVSPAPQPPEIPLESVSSSARGLIAARLRQAQRAGGLPHPDALLPLSARIAALRARLVEGARKKPR
ncbi:MAG: MerR family transcriptional regulator [Rhodobacteraceae bacterium PARR1]|nr:MAG: MerR family transcriptional regulator [Rhodobacteraceae bacterium PARR1]